MTQKEINALAHEVDFWARFVYTDRFLKNWAGGKGQNENHVKEIKDVLRPYRRRSILDVGSGAASPFAGMASKVVAVDPLAKFFEIFFDYEEHNVPVPVACRGEELLKIFKPESFDVVHISNALDHCQQPNEVMENMWAIVKSGGILIVQGFADEGISQEYEGLHQWNIEAEKTGIVIRNEDGRQEYHYPGECRTKILEMRKDKVKTWLVYTRRK